MEILVLRLWMLPVVFLVAIFMPCTRTQSLTIAIETNHDKNQWDFLRYNSTELEMFKQCVSNTSSETCRVKVNDKENVTKPTFQPTFVDIPTDDIGTGETDGKISIWSCRYASFLPSVSCNKKTTDNNNLCSTNNNCQPLVKIQWSGFTINVLWDSSQTARITQWDTSQVNVTNCCNNKDTTTKTVTTTMTSAKTIETTGSLPTTANTKTSSSSVTILTTATDQSGTKTSSTVVNTGGTTNKQTPAEQPNGGEKDDNEDDDSFSPLTIGLIAGLGVAVAIIIFIVLAFLYKKRRNRNSSVYKRKHATTPIPHQDDINDINQMSLSPVIQGTSLTATTSKKATACVSPIMSNSKSSTNYTEIDYAAIHIPAVNVSNTNPDGNNSIPQSPNEYEEPSHSSPYDHYSTVDPTPSTENENNKLSPKNSKIPPVPSTSAQVNNTSSQSTPKSAATEAISTSGNTAKGTMSSLTYNQRPAEQQVYSTLRQEIRNIKNPYEVIPISTKSESSNPPIPQIPTTVSANEPSLTAPEFSSASKPPENEKKPEGVKIVKLPLSQAEGTNEKVPLRHPEHYNDVYCNTLGSSPTKTINGVHYSVVVKEEKPKNESVYFELEKEDSTAHPKLTNQERNQTEESSKEQKTSEGDLFGDQDHQTNRPSDQPAVASFFNDNQLNNGDQTVKGVEQEVGSSDEQTYLNCKEAAKEKNQSYSNVSL